MYEAKALDLAERAARTRTGAERDSELIGKGLAAVAVALLEVAQAIRWAADNRR